VCFLGRSPSSVVRSCRTWHYPECRKTNQRDGCHVPSRSCSRIDPQRSGRDRQAGHRHMRWFLIGAASDRPARYGWSTCCRFTTGHSGRLRAPAGKLRGSGRGTAPRDAIAIHAKGGGGLEAGAVSATVPPGRNLYFRRYSRTRQQPFMPILIRSKSGGGGGELASAAAPTPFAPTNFLGSNAGQRGALCQCARAWCVRISRPDTFETPRYG